MSDNLGLLPYRRRIVSVSESRTIPSALSQVTHITPVGRPIHVNRSANPSMEEITRVQKLYIQELERFVFDPLLCRSSHTQPLHNVRIWNKYKDEFAKARLREMMIVE